MVGYNSGTDRLDFDWPWPKGKLSFCESLSKEGLRRTYTHGKFSLWKNRSVCVVTLSFAAESGARPQLVL